MICYIKIYIMLFHSRDSTAKCKKARKMINPQSSFTRHGLLIQIVSRKRFDLFIAASLPPRTCIYRVVKRQTTWSRIQRRASLCVLMHQRHKGLSSTNSCLIPLGVYLPSFTTIPPLLCRIRIQVQPQASLAQRQRKRESREISRKTIMKEGGLRIRPRERERRGRRCYERIPGRVIIAWKNRYNSDSP